MTSTLVRALAIAGLALTVACAGGETTPAKDTGKAAAKTEAPAKPEIDAAALANDSENMSIVPSPIETQNALEKAGIDTKLNTLIPKHDFDLTAAEVDPAAVRTGVVLADMLLTVKTSSKEDLIARVEAVREGMRQLNGGKDIDRMLTDIRERIKGDGVTRDELLKEFDELSGAVIPELEFNGQKRVVPLIQAGSWLEGANLVAQAVKAKDNPGAADTLLKQPKVVEYFITYVKTDGAEKAPAAVTKTLEESLNQLKGLAEKKEPLTAADIETTITATNGVLALL